MTAVRREREERGLAGRRRLDLKARRERLGYRAADIQDRRNERDHEQRREHSRSTPRDALAPAARCVGHTGQLGVRRRLRLINLEAGVSDVGKAARAISLQAATQEPSDRSGRVRRKLDPLGVLVRKRQRIRAIVAADMHDVSGETCQSTHPKHRCRRAYRRFPPPARELSLIARGAEVDHAANVIIRGCP